MVGEKGVYQVEILALIEVMKVKEMLSEEVQEKVDSLLEGRRYLNADRIAVDNQSSKQTLAD